MNILMPYLKFLDQYLINYYFPKKTKKSGRPPARPGPAPRPGTCLSPPASWPAQTGTQAGHVPEPAGLLAGQTDSQAGAVTTRGPAASAHGTARTSTQGGGEGTFDAAR